MVWLSLVLDMTQYNLDFQLQALSICQDNYSKCVLLVEERGQCENKRPYEFWAVKPINYKHQNELENTK